MATTTPFAFNTGSTISGTTQIGNIAIGITDQDYSGQPGGVRWWMGPNEDVGHLIIAPDTGFTHQSPIGINAGIRFKRSLDKTESSFIQVANSFASTNFSNITDASDWLVGNGYPITYPCAAIFDSDTLTYISGLTTTLSYKQVSLINRFVTGIKTGLTINSLSDIADAIYILAGETSESSLRNIVKRQHDATAVNSPTFTQYEGFQGNGSSMYINTHFIPKSGVTFTQNSASWCIYIRNNITSAYMGSMNYAGDPPILTIIPYFYDQYGYTYYGINDGTISVATITAPKRSDGFWILNRGNSTTRGLYRNNNLIIEHSVTSTGCAPYEIYLDANNNGGGVNYHSWHQVAFSMFGAGLNSGARTVVTNCIEEYMDARGKGVL